MFGFTGLSGSLPSASPAFVKTPLIGEDRAENGRVRSFSVAHRQLLRTAGVGGGKELQTCVMLLGLCQDDLSGSAYLARGDIIKSLFSDSGRRRETGTDA